MKRAAKWVGTSLLIIVVGLLAFFTLESQKNEPVATINNHIIRLSITDTEAERSKGLSGTRNLASGSGMLFIFDSNDRHGIWMKDMKYPIDVIWLDETRKVVEVQARIAPETYPKIFRPTTDARYVLELLAGAANSYEIRTGQTVKF